MSRTDVLGVGAGDALALADEPDDVAAGALDWLHAQREQITSLYSLAWGAIALNVLGQLSNDWRTGIIDLWNATSASRRNPVDTSLCLLALAASASHPFRVA